MKEEGGGRSFCKQSANIRTLVCGQSDGGGRVSLFVFDFLYGGCSGNVSLTGSLCDRGFSVGGRGKIVIQGVMCLTQMTGSVY